MRPLSALADAFDERHGLVELALGLWSLVRPFARLVREAPPAARPAPPDEEDDVLALLLGLTSFAWHLEVLFPDGAPAAENFSEDSSAPENFSAPENASAPERLFR